MNRKRRFEKMYEEYVDDIYRYLFVRICDKQVAQDLTAETFMRGWARLDSFDFKQPRPWLYTIAHNALMDYWRKKKPLPLEESEGVIAEGRSLEDEVDAGIAVEKIQSALAQLPDEMQSIITMRFMLGYSAKQTADSLGISEGSVRIIQYRALKRMRELMV